MSKLGNLLFTCNGKGMSWTIALDVPLVGIYTREMEGDCICVIISGSYFPLKFFNFFQISNAFPMR